MTLIRAELLKIRRRQATWVMLGLALFLLVIIFLLGSVTFQITGSIEFPAAYAGISQFAFGLGGLLAVVYSAAFVGADWNWGVLRNVVARGESRARYMLAKAAALAIVLAIATVLIYLVGIVLAFVAGMLFNLPVESPLRGRGLQDLVDNLLLGYPVLLERASLGFAVAVVLRSQLAGAVVGIVFFLGESILKFTLLGATLAGRAGDFIGSGGSIELIGPEWYQFLPVGVGDYVIGAAPGGSGGLTNIIEQFLIRPVPLPLALLSVAIYLVSAMTVAIVVLNRQEIT
ncbi:hypothetical protein BH24CHL5_BH24CHL5_08280 [soil metagenome]